MQSREDYTRGDIYRENGDLYLDGVNLRELAEEEGTPLYVYGSKRLRNNYLVYKEAFSFSDNKICYAVKANYSTAILKELASLGAGADIVSGGELYLALRAGIKPENIVFAGVGKTDNEIREALKAKILMFNVESIQELEVLSSIAEEEGVEAPVALRVNPDIDPKSHPKISTGVKESKFGIPRAEALEVYRKAAKMPNIRVIGVHFHIGSQITDLSPFRLTAEASFNFAEELRKEGIPLKYVDIGGGLGIDYENTGVPTPSDIAGILKEYFDASPYKLILEPGRSIVGNAGYLITSITYLKKGKDKNFVIVDAGFNDILRPAMYGSYHEVLSLSEDGESLVADLVGPVCETGDVLASARKIEGVRRGNKLLICDAGAYGFSMASNYNSRPRPAEVMIKGGEAHLLRKRGSYSDFTEGEL